MSQSVKPASSDVVSKEESSHFQQLLRELANSETSTSDGRENFDHISYIIKQILQTGKEEIFSEQLTGFIYKKEAEIEKMCGFHYQEFVQSVDQLLKVREGAGQLKDTIIELNQQMQATGSQLVAKKKQMVENQQTMLNIELAIESLQSCLFVLDIANKINASLESRKYYSALKMLEELRSTHLRNLRQYTFAKHMNEWIPLMQEKVREAVLSELRDWLVSIRENTRKIGDKALEHIARKQERAKNKSARAERGGLAILESSVNIGLSLDVINTDDEDDDLASNNDVKIDFKPLYQCLHIHEVLDKRNEFRARYEEQRKMQADLMLSQKFSFDGGDMKGFRGYLNDVVGFFMIESIVLSSTHNFRSRSAVELLWVNAMEKMNDVIIASLQECRDPDLFLSIRLAVVNFINTMESYGFAVTSLMDLMLSLLDRYADLMKSICSDNLIQIIDDDEYAPQVVNNQHEYDEVMKAYKLKEESKTKTLKHVGDWAASIRFPKTLPFSRGFPQLCSRIKDFINGFYRFAEGFEQQYNEMDDLLKKSLENLLIQSVGGTLLQKIMVNNLSQVVQIIVNLEHLEMACAEFETILTEKRISHKAGTVKLSATKSFRESRVICEKRLFELLNMKIDDFLELADYDWLASSNPHGHSPYLDDLVSFLTGVITSTLANLSSTMRSQIYMDVFKHLAKAVHNVLLSPEVKRISPTFVEVLDPDIAFLEKFAAGVEGVNGGEAFAELRQTVTFLKSPHWEDILNPAVKEKRYARIKLNNLAALLEKMKGDTSVFGKSTSAEKARRKSIDGVLKGIKALGR
ncbi:hypothetical protein HDU85_004465 [Gaertneriomyces sp. JEL0708]|nr:hypothetical protein HDU85_004465 [Gaertneriomyces sp. JEL0708]